MEKNWIEEIIEFVRNAMNEGLKVEAYPQPNKNDPDFRFTINKDNTNVSYDNNCYNTRVIHIIINNYISIITNRGYFTTNINLSERDCLELQAISLAVKEYKEDIAISEFENFFRKDDKPTTIDNLDDDD